MSRIGREPILVPAGTVVTIDGSKVTVKGPKGTLVNEFNPIIKVELVDNVIHVTRPDDEKTSKQLHGTVRALLANMVKGVNEVFKKELVISGIGFKATMQGANIVVDVGYTNPVIIAPIKGVKIETPSLTEIVVSGTDKQAVGQIAALIRGVREPEPYLGKGIAYKNEHIRRKEGKKAAKK